MKLPIASTILLLSIAPLVHAGCLVTYFAGNTSITITDNGINKSFGKFKKYLGNIVTELVEESGAECADLNIEVLELFRVDKMKFAVHAFKEACDAAMADAISADANTSIGNFRHSWPFELCR